MRLALAVTVVICHAMALGGFSNQSFLNGTTTGAVAVYGFFGLSGFLIARSATTNSPGRYLWQRFLRIFPAYWVCLVLTGFLFGTLVWATLPAGHCSLLCYLDPSQDGPLSYVYRNWALRLNQIFVSPKYLSYHLVNGPLWTLFYEFLCYLMILVLGMVGLLRHRVGTALIAAGAWLTVTAITLSPGGPAYFAYYPYAHITQMEIVKLAPIFLVGSVIYLYRDWIPDSGWLALACSVAFLASLWLPIGPKGSPVPELNLADSDLLTPLIAYPLLWLGIHLPLQTVGARHDFSYGTYIYAWPVTQTLIAWGAIRWGYGPFLALVFLCTAPFALGSWWLVERRALRLKKVSSRQWLARVFGHGNVEPSESDA